MPCSYCGEDRKIMARGLCSPCYQRQWSTGSLARKLMSNVGKMCGYEGCADAAVSKGMCSRHYGYTRHPLTNTWHLTCNRYRGQVPKEWVNSFAAFLADVGERPGSRHQLRRIRPDMPWSKDNVKWMKPLYNQAYPPAEMKEYHHRSKLRRSFGIMPEDYDRMMEDQDGRCAICDGKQDINKKTGEPRRLGVDHCHATHKIRGLLCVSCNRGLGYFDDKIERLKSAIAYLEKHSTD